MKSNRIASIIIESNRELSESFRAYNHSICRDYLLCTVTASAHIMP